MDLKVPGDMADEKAIVGGRRMEFTYGDCQKEMDMVNRAFLETMLEAMPMAWDSSILFRLMG